MAAYENLVGHYEYSNMINHPHTATAIALADLLPGNSVLDLSAGSGRLIAEAKRAVRHGFCVAVDAVPGFLAVDIPWQLQQSGLAVYPNGNADNQVHLMHANITHSSLAQRLMNLPGAPQNGFDSIFAVQLWASIPSDQRLPLLCMLRRLLNPVIGHIILSMDALFSTEPPLAWETNTPIQFRTSQHSSAPALMLRVHEMRNEPPVPVARGPPRNASHVVGALQVAPDFLWVEAQMQCCSAAKAAGLGMLDSHNLGMGPCFNLPDAVHSPPQEVLDDLTDQAIEDEFLTPLQLQGRFACIGRTIDTLLRRQIPDFESLPPETQGHAIAKRLASPALDRYITAPLLHGPITNAVLSQKVKFNRVAVMGVLRRW